MGRVPARSRLTSPARRGGAVAPRALVLVALLTCLGALVACAEKGGAESVADAFAEAYFRHADQEGAKRYTAFGATKMLDAEIDEVGKLRADGYTPSAASLQVDVDRGERSTRGDRVRFDYAITYRAPGGPMVKRADVELALVHGEWKVVRLGLAGEGDP